MKKEEMIRHFKWHKKRDESLQHGFMRYSPLDSCEGKFGSCTHDGRQTHYHCLQVSIIQTHYDCLQVSFEGKFFEFLAMVFSLFVCITLYFKRSIPSPA